MEEAKGEYKAALDEMVAAMNTRVDVQRDVSRKFGKRLKSARSGIKKPLSALRPKGCRCLTGRKRHSLR